MNGVAELWWACVLDTAGFAEACIMGEIALVKSHKLALRRITKNIELYA